LARLVIGIGLGIVFVLSIAVTLGLLLVRPVTPLETRQRAVTVPSGTLRKSGDEELAYLLVKLELQTRREILGHLTRKQSPVPGVDKLYQRLLVKNLILPAAVADRVFSETVPSATSGRAWVKMVVDEPRNPNNRGDETALTLLAELRHGAVSAERATSDVCYYAEPIRAQAVCLFCHGEPRGAPDPYFPQFRKEGWREGQIIGAVIARVAPAELEGG
jgi:hypothetical protein